MPGALMLHPLCRLHVLHTVRAAASMLIWQGVGSQPSAGAMASEKHLTMLVMTVVQNCTSLHNTFGQVLGFCTLNVMMHACQSSSKHADLAG